MHLEAQLGYWRAQLAGAPTVLELPTPRARAAHQTFEGASLPVELPADLAAAVLARSREASVTPYMLLLAVFGLLLYRRTGQDDILVGSPFANRSRAEFEELVGFVANTLVLRVQLAGNPAFSTLLGRVRETTLGALDHQEVPFDHVVEAMRVQRRSDVNPLVQVNFRARVEAPATLQLPGATTGRVDVDAGFAAFELALDLHVLEEAIVGELLYNVELFDLASAVGLAEDYAALLRQVLDRPEVRLLDLEVPSESAPATDDVAAGASSIRGFRKAADRDEAPAGESR
jgi:non-ribosomal peptide synthetase component F